MSKRWNISIAKTGTAIIAVCSICKRTTFSRDDLEYCPAKCENTEAKAKQTEIVVKKANAAKQLGLF